MISNSSPALHDHGDRNASIAGVVIRGVGLQSIRGDFHDEDVKPAACGQRSGGMVHLF